MTPKNPAAVALGRKGGHARAKSLTPEQRSDAARKAVEARWARIKELAEKITRGTKQLEAKNAARTRRKSKEKL